LPVIVFLVYPYIQLFCSHCYLLVLLWSAPLQQDLGFSLPVAVDLAPHIDVHFVPTSTGKDHRLLAWGDCVAY